MIISGNKQREPFSKGHLHDFLLLNVDRSQNVQYDQNRFTCHDVDFTLRLHSAGMLVCRFNSFSVMKKQIAIGGYKTFIIKTKVGILERHENTAMYKTGIRSMFQFVP